MVFFGSRVHPGSCTAISHHVSLRFLPSVSFSIFVFHDLDTFEEDWSAILYKAPQSELFWCFLMIRPGLLILEKGVTEVKCSFHCFISEYMISMWLMTDVGCDHLVMLFIQWHLCKISLALLLNIKLGKSPVFTECLFPFTMGSPITCSLGLRSVNGTVMSSQHSAFSRRQWISLRNRHSQDKKDVFT